MLLSGDAAQAMGDGLDVIRAETDVPTAFPRSVLSEAEDAARRLPGPDHRDRTGEHFVTLDPETSVDLDQAFAIERSGTDLILHYAIADVGWFVRPGDALDVEAFERAVTVYLPDRRSPLYPRVLSEDAASLLPDVDRPAVVFTVRIGEDGIGRLDGVERALIRNRAKLAYDAVAPSDLPDGFVELHRRFSIAEALRGAPRVEFPEQVVTRGDDGGYDVRFRPRLPSEEQNAALSLATNLAVADTLLRAQTGLFRVMPDVGARQMGRLRNSARVFGLTWPSDVQLDQFVRSLPRDDPRTSAFLVAIRRAAGGASYEPYRPGVVPWHAAVAATYAQATAPLRRLQDRYVIEAALAVANGRPVDDSIADGFERLPAAMARGEQRANRAEREALELAEAVVMSGREGRVYHAVVVDEDARGVEFQMADPPILAHVHAHHVDPGDAIEVRVVSVDVTARSVVFERVA